jgi:hypothetical protein
MSVQCGNCGAVNDESDAECWSCRDDLSDALVAFVATPATRPSIGTANRSRAPARGRRPVVVAVVGLAAVVSAAAWLSARVTKRDAEHSQRAALQVTGPSLRKLPAADRIILVAVSGHPPGVRLGDLATGELHALVLPAPFEMVFQAIPRRAALVVLTNQRAYSVLRPWTSRPVVISLGPAAAALRSTHDDRVWLFASGRDVYQISTAGERVTGRRALAPTWQLVVGGMDRDRVLVQRFSDGGFALWDPRSGRFGPVYGQTRPFASIIAAAGRFVAWRDPECLGSCAIFLTDLLTGRERQMIRQTEENQVSFSPDGRSVVLGGGFGAPAREPVAVIDLRSGREVWTSEPMNTAGITWSPDSRWVFFADDTTLFAHRLGTAKVAALGHFFPGGALWRT